MKSWFAHYKNKYPKGTLIPQGEGNLDVFGADGRHKVAIRGGKDCSENFACDDAHDLAPIPKNTRFMKHYPDGRLGKAEEHDDRFKTACDLAEKYGGRVPSIAELEKAGEKLKGESDKPWNREWTPGESSSKS